MSFKELKVERVEGELAVALSECYPPHEHGFVKIGQKKWFLPYTYVEESDNIYNFEIRPDDTWIIAYPRSGKLFSLFRYNNIIYSITIIGCVRFGRSRPVHFFLSIAHYVQKEDKVMLIPREWTLSQIIYFD